MYRSEARKDWRGFWCHHTEYERRNPQDFLKVPPERPAVPDPRPRTVDFLTTPVTKDDL